MLKYPDYVVLKKSVGKELEYSEGLLPLVGLALHVRLVVAAETAERLTGDGLVVAQEFFGDVLNVVGVAVENICAVRIDVFSGVVLGGIAAVNKDGVADFMKFTL
jgi:hypothetical protein